jgi:hypothetical protein
MLQSQAWREPVEDIATAVQIELPFSLAVL